MGYKLQCPGSGPIPSSIFLCGEKPGLEEIRNRKPFIGRSGDEQNDYLRRYHLSTRTFYLTNLIKHFIGDRSPTDDEIAYWSPTLQREIEDCNPQLIIAVGAIATRYFLGQSAALETVHGIPHHPGAFDISCAYRAPFGSIILPIYHPALGFKDSDARSLIAWDYAQVAEAVKSIKAGIAIEPRYDRYAGKEVYIDVSGTEFEERFEDDFDEETNEFAIDTEGILGDEFSLQASYREGHGLMVRNDRSDFWRALRVIKNRAITPPKHREPSLVIGHNLMHDIAIVRGMGQCLRRAPRLFDTMYAAYITRIESYSDDPKGRSRGKQGLKPLAWRHNGTRMQSWEDVTSEIALRDRIAYLERVAIGTWPAPRLRAEQEHDGSWSITKKTPVQKLAAKILTDYRADKRNKKGEPVDIEDRWYGIADYVREVAEHDLGPLPNGSIRRLFAHDPEKAIRYAAADSDQTLRLKRRLYPELESRNLLSLMSKGMRVLPMIEEMQYNGFPASRSYFESLSAQMWDEMMGIVKEMSKLYFGGRPFNPCSPPQTRELLAIRGLKSEKQTPGGDDSTAQKSIEHHAANDPAIAKLFEFRKREHIRDKFCTVILRALDRYRAQYGDDNDIGRVMCQILNTRTATRRLAAKNPNLLNIPIRTLLGLLVREGFLALPGLILLGGDLSQIEYRILAHFSNDRTLVKFMNQVVRPGEDKPDIHKQTAAWLNGIDIRDVTKQQRSVAKTTNYLKIYLGTGHGMADQLRKDGIEGWTVDRCDELIRETDKMFPGVPRWVREVIAETYETEVSLSYEGMPRYLPGIRSRHEATRREAERHAVSQRIQGTAQDMLQNSMIWLTPRIWALQDRGEKVEPILQVHDELIFMVETDISPTMTTLLRWALVKEGGVPMRVPIECDIHNGYRWSELKD